MPKKKSPQEGKKRVDDSNVLGLHAEVLEQPITQTLELNYMPYAMSVIVSRAIPEIDGFKPSHRKLLYTMYQMKLLGGARTKSANVVGATMKLNPHGDAAIYDTMVRLSRGYGALLHPLVDSKGNFGKVYSRDMAWAAPRYTEVRLDAICGEFFRDIDQDAVDFVPNYDGTMTEPTLLPTTFPNVLVSANQGIAVGMASNLCGFNLGEVCDVTAAYLKNPGCDLLSLLKAPDFPTGGDLLYDPAELSAIYETGRGSFKVQAKWRYLKAENLIEVYEIPYSTTVEAIMDKVAELVKSGKVRSARLLRDETDLSGLKLTIDLKRGTDPDKLMAKLCRMTPCGTPSPATSTSSSPGCPGAGGAADFGGVDRLAHGVGAAADLLRPPAPEGKAPPPPGPEENPPGHRPGHPDHPETEEDAEVIPNLMIGFGIDQVQAEYVAEIKLRNINKEYILKRTQETEELEKEIADLQDLVGSQARIKAVIQEELAAVKKKYAVPRRTTLLYELPEEAPAEAEAVPDYPVHLFLSREGYFKKITPQSLRMASEQKYKEGDGPYLQWEGTNRDELLVFTDRQQCYKAWVSDFDDAKASVLGDYLPTKLGFDEGESFLWACVPGDYSGSLLFFFANGKAARVELSGYQTQTKRKRLTGAYCDKSPLVRAFLLREEMEMAVWSTEGRCLIFQTAALSPKTTRTTQGVNVMTLKPKYKVEGAAPLAETPIQNAARYRARSLPVAGALLKEEDRGEEQMSLL